MDLHLTAAEATEQERAAVDALLGVPSSGWHGAERTEVTHRVARGGASARDERHLLLPALHALQSGVGWISPGGLNYVSERLTVPPAEAYGVATFYAMFSTEPRPGDVVHVCDDIACRVAGAADLCAQLEREVGPEGVDHGGATWMRSPCLGMCERAPVMLAQRTGRDDATFAAASAATFGAATGSSSPPDVGAVAAPQTAEPATREGLRLLRRVGLADPTSFDDYHAHGGYEAMRRAVELGTVATIREVTDAKLMGRGGAAFPTGVKWKAVAEQPAHPHYFVCNADESEPGTFKDRVVMEQDPYAVIEALTIAGFATGAEEGYLYIRGEYPLATARLEHAIAECRHRGYLGPNVMGEGFAFDIELRRGAGAYICGEETALFNSLEGKRGEPRNKPPFPVQRGLFGKPTGINNVETLINVLEILRIGGEAYARIGTESSTGPRLFCLSGNVEKPGLYEADFGITLRELLAMAGGVNGELRAVLLGGAAGGFVTADDLDIRMTFEDARAGGYTLGSGVVMAFNEDVDMVQIVLRIARFFRDESCGQCVPCRVGTVRQEEALYRLVNERTLGSREDELALLGDIAKVMTDASICGLGQTAASAVQSAVTTLHLFDGAPGMTAVPLDPPRKLIDVEIDGETVRVPEGATILDACRADGIDTPTLCYAENLTPVNACRVCVVEVEGARTLVPACSRAAEPGMKIKTDTERVQHSRKLVMEFLASSVEMELAHGDVHRWMEEYGAHPARFGAVMEPLEAGERDARVPGHHHVPTDPMVAEGVAQPVKIDNELYVRDYSRCILCYKCVEACGVDAQNTFAIAVAGRGFDARISTEYAVGLDESACVYCGNCIGVCPTGALMFTSEHTMREAGTWDESAQAVTSTICPYCGVGCQLDVHVQDNTIVKVTSPADHYVTNGHLCVKGRFGFQYVQRRKRREEAQ